MEIEMKIRGLMVDPSTNMPIVLLKDPQSEALLPIWVGLYEANAIALEVEKTQTPRPLTHDLLRSAIDSLNAQVKRVVVTGAAQDRADRLRIGDIHLASVGFDVDPGHLRSGRRVNYCEFGIVRRKSLG